MFTIHNLAYQGVFDKSWVPRLGLSWHDFTINGFEFFDRLSFMKAGINFADAITTVSPTYAEEIQRPEYGYGLDGVIGSRAMRSSASSTASITTNGIPRRIRSCRRRSTPTASTARPRPSAPLLEAFGFTITDELLARPVIGMVSRMVDQKGLDLIAVDRRAICRRSTRRS